MHGFGVGAPVGEAVGAVDGELVGPQVNRRDVGLLGLSVGLAVG